MSWFYRRLTLAACVLVAAEVAHAEPGQLHGFATQYLLHTSDNRFFGDTDDRASWDYREIGVSGSWRPVSDLLLSGQVISRKAGADADGSPDFDYLFADWSLEHTATRQFGLRLGRVTNPIGLYNDTRDVFFTRPGILLPQSIYFDRTRDLAISVDGGAAYAQFNPGDQEWQLQVNYGLPRTESEAFQRVFIGTDVPGDVGGRGSVLARLLYSTDNGRWRAGISYGVIHLDYRTAPGSPLASGGDLFKPLYLSLQYNAEKFSLTSEVASRPIERTGINVPAGVTFKRTGLSYYLQAEYRFTPKWQALLRYDVLYSDKDDKDGSKFAAASGRPAHNMYAKDWTVGLSWRPRPSWMLALEVHRVDGTAWLTGGDNPSLATTTGRWNLVALALSYRF